MTGYRRQTTAASTELAALYARMRAAAETTPLPPRFEAIPGPAGDMLLLDRYTGRTATVSLFAYAEARAALNDLFRPGGTEPGPAGTPSPRHEDAATLTAAAVVMETYRGGLGTTIAVLRETANALRDPDGRLAL